MTQQDESGWRELCNQAMTENDPNKLLRIYLALNRVMEEEQRVSAPTVSCGRHTNH